MATVGVTIEMIDTAYPNGQAAPVIGSAPIAKENVTSSVTSAQTTIEVPANAKGSLVWRVACDSPLWVAVGADPTASAGNDRLLTGGVLEFAAAPGQKVAVIDA